jgi:diaminohydroxyphosphoribosylaminopyrimidine deaminase/5-amino-6-(5-phosphoribosylamino)uracil reductase
MRVALSLANRTLGSVWPNPAVGCVIVNKNRVVGRGWTQPTGRPHAEVVALAQAGDLARGATAYVTLEPCAHTGKTSPCSSALINAGIGCVVTAMTDPDPRVAGKGHEMLRTAGIEVIEGVLPSEAEESHIGFLTRIRKKRPMITLKLAMTLDGRIATQTGDSQWITGDATRRMVHMMRAQHDAVMVGSNTSITDDPDLRPRISGVDPKKLRIVLDTQLRSSPNGNLAKTSKDAPLWLCHGSTADKTAWLINDADLIECPVHQDHLDLEKTLEILGERGLTRIFCEGGGTLASGLLKHDLVDRLIVMTAGCLIGADGLSGVGSLGVLNLSDAPRFDLLRHETIGIDTLTHWSRAE